MLLGEEHSFAPLQAGIFFEEVRRHFVLGGWFQTAYLHVSKMPLKPM